MRAAVIIAISALAGCALTPEQWIAQCIDDGNAPSACRAHMDEQVRLSTPVLICRPVGDETHCYPGS
jgi:hypothetical protein